MSSRAYVIVYPATTSCSEAAELFRSARMTGAATVTMVASKIAMNWPSRSTASSRPVLPCLVGADEMEMVMEPEHECHRDSAAGRPHPGSRTTWHQDGDPVRMR